LQSSAEREGGRLRIVTLRGKPERVIPAHAQLHAARTIVVGRDYGTSRFWRNGGVASRISRSSPVPVLVLPAPRARSVERAAPLSLHRIMVAVDFNVASAVALRAAADLTKRHGARLTMVHAMSLPRQMVFSGGEAARLVSQLPAEASAIAARLKRKGRALGAGEAEPVVVTGVPHRTIIDAAANGDADLIVMGVAPRTAFDEAAFGSTLRAVLRRATVPVLVVPVVAGGQSWPEHANGRDGFSIDALDGAAAPLAA
jgi:nucleotide-binding universal stress UspA family protein